MSSRTLDQLRAALDHMDPSLRADQLSFFRHVLACGPDSVEELAQRVVRVQAPPMLRQLVLEAAFYHSWPAWVPILSRMLQYENDPERFEVGAQALGSIGTSESVAALRSLHTTRHGEPFEGILARELRDCDPDAAFGHAFSQLLEGTKNPRLANEAAFRLAQLVDGSRLEAIRGAIRHPDLLVFRHGLQLLSRISSPESAQALREILEETHRECLEDRLIKEALAVLKPMGPIPALEEISTRLASLPPSTSHPGGSNPGGSRITGYGGFLQSLRTIAQENKIHRLQAAVAQVAEDLVHRARRQAFAVDAAAEGVAGMAQRGLLEAAGLLGLLREACREHTGREGVARALGRLACAEDLETLDLIRSSPDPVVRSAAVEALGEREDATMQEVLVQFCKDPVADLADRALIHLGKLPGREALARRFLQTPTLEDQALGLRFIAQEHLESLTPDLLDMLQITHREELSIQILTALGAAGSAEASRPILELLHSGQSRRMQVALAEALRDLATPETAMALGEKADAIRALVLHSLAAEAFLQAWKDGAPMPAPAAERMLHHIQEAWNSPDGWAFRLRLARLLKGKRLESADVRGVLGQMFQDALAAGKGVHGWDTAEVTLVQDTLRECLAGTQG